MVASNDPRQANRYSAIRRVSRCLISTGSNTRTRRNGKPMARPVWDTAFAGYTEARLVDSVSGQWTEMAWDREALKLPDPGYTEVTDATILTHRDEIALNDEIASTLFDTNTWRFSNFRRKTTELINLVGRTGNSPATVIGATLWCVKYDVLCAVDINTRKARYSAVLQPRYSDPRYGMMTSGFIVSHAPPRNSMDGWFHDHIVATVY